MVAGTLFRLDNNGPLYRLKHKPGAFAAGKCCLLYCGCRNRPVNALCNSFKYLRESNLASTLSQTMPGS